MATESRVQEAIPEFAPQLTTIYVVQRISAALDLDQIYLLENGEIITRGPHDELMAKKGFYYALYMSQFKSKAPGGNGAGAIEFAKHLNCQRARLAMPASFSRYGLWCQLSRLFNHLPLRSDVWPRLP